MCWVSNNKPALRIAEEDIPVFKIVNIGKKNRITSLYLYFEYLPGILYKTSVSVEGWFYMYLIHNGFHSYSPDQCIAKKILNRYRVYSNDLVLEDIDLFFHPKVAYASCIIPKGSEYYINRKGECVSNCIKIINIEDI